ncbi:hypothetical protein BRADI_1g27874v3 [Brachypodium distachyon]|uniref:RNase H type-1 domain-containing protein n=1 Tax=Brachypodium distachyon TaxID=15368 RepID=A0A0Q3KYN3_BRADI|nr:hypothetical protein BRADI_1g27874v3 [Brachypodium distachyon]
MRICSILSFSLSITCPLCKIHCEDTLHAFFKCPRVMEIWENLGLADLINELDVPIRSGSEVLEALLMSTDAPCSLFADVGRKEMIVTACWYTWWERHQAVRGEAIAKPARSSHAIAALATNYFRARRQNAGIRRHGWVRPKDDFVKLNVDAAFNADAETGSCYGIENVADAPTAEAIALRDGLLLAGQVGCNRLEINSDCMEVVQTMLDGGKSIGPAAVIYEECSFLVRGFGFVSLNHCPRESNLVAHTLARQAVDSQRVVWLEDPPNFISSLLVNDVSVFINQ